MKESILISRCLLGEKVRYDGGDCEQDKKLISKLEDKFNLIAICPEVMAGMSTPREPIEIKSGRVISKSGEDVTDMFKPVTEKLKSIIIENKIHKAILKDFSPSCGSTKIYSGNFDGELIDGVGVVTSYLEQLNVVVYSEFEIEKLIL